MLQYNSLLKDILNNGKWRENRTGEDTIGIFGTMRSYDLSKGLPLHTGRKLFTRGMFHEMLWMMGRGDTNVKYLQDHNVKFWDEWALTGDEVVCYRNKDTNELIETFKEHLCLQGDVTQEMLHNILKVELKDEFDSEYLESFHKCVVQYALRHGLELNTEVTLRWFADNNVVTDIIDLANTMVDSKIAINLMEAEHLIHNEYHRMIEESSQSDLDEISIVKELCMKYGFIYSSHKPEHKIGDLGPVYGKQWCDWNGVNQIDALVEGLRLRPYSRRHIISAWNVSDLPDETKSPHQNVLDGKQALAPCHVLAQFYVDDIHYKVAQHYIDTCTETNFLALSIAAEEYHLVEVEKYGDELHRYHDKFGSVWVGNLRVSLKSMIPVMESMGYKMRELSSILYQRSADCGVGAPINVPFYSTLTMAIANMLGMDVGVFHHMIGDAHIYENQIPMVKEWIERETTELPTLLIHSKPEKFSDYKFEDFEVIGYAPQPAIKFPRPAV